MTLQDVGPRSGSSRSEALSHQVSVARSPSPVKGFTSVVNAGRAILPPRVRTVGRFSAARALQGLLAIGAISAFSVLPSSCETGGIGDPCVPEDEYLGEFSGFQVSQENIESRSFQCESRICLVNHFQGRVSCPQGQQDPLDPANGRLCTSLDGACSGEGETCTISATFAPECGTGLPPVPEGFTCSAEGFAACDESSPCPTNYFCDKASSQCVVAVCHNPDNCQVANPENPSDNDGKVCCIPGTTKPVSAQVCGQCAEEGLRNAANSVYCSCRCGVAEGQPEDENFNFCECPDGFECAEVRPDVGLGDQQLTGKYCVKADDPIIQDGKVDPSAAQTECGDVIGFKGGECKGNATTSE